MPATVDRRIAQAVAYKRIFTGTFGLLAGLALVPAVWAHGLGGALPLVVLAFAIFFGGGAWTLWDGLRVRRELRRQSDPAASARGPETHPPRGGR
jgi:hypothetical protein